MSETQHKVSGLIGAQSYTIGATKVTVLMDGHLQIGAEMLQGVSPEEYSSALAAVFYGPETHLSGVSGFLIESQGKRILVDAGAGSALGPDLGNVGGALQGLDVAPDSIDQIIATHLHADHVGGLVDKADAFSKAEFLVHGAEIDFWCNPEIRAGAPDDAKFFFDVAKAAVDAFGDRVSTLTDGQDLGHGITVKHLPGHTPGHCGLRIEDGGESLFIWGDIVHVPPVQLAMPEVTIAFDIDPDQARTTRAGILDMVATDRLKIAGSHITFPCVGHLAKAGSGYRFEPQPWEY